MSGRDRGSKGLGPRRPPDDDDDDDDDEEEDEDYRPSDSETDSGRGSDEDQDEGDEEDESERESQRGRTSRKRGQQPASPRPSEGKRERSSSRASDVSASASAASASSSASSSSSSSSARPPPPPPLRRRSSREGETSPRSPQPGEPSPRSLHQQPGEPPSRRASARRHKPTARERAEQKKRTATASAAASARVQDIPSHAIACLQHWRQQLQTSPPFVAPVLKLHVVYAQRFHVYGEESYSAGESYDEEFAKTESDFRVLDVESKLDVVWVDILHPLTLTTAVSVDDDDDGDGDGDGPTTNHFTIQRGWRIPLQFDPVRQAFVSPQLDGDDTTDEERVYATVHLSADALRCEIAASEGKKTDVKSATTGVMDAFAQGDTIIVTLRDPPMTTAPAKVLFVGSTLIEVGTKGNLIYRKDIRGVQVVARAPPSSPTSKSKSRRGTKRKATAAAAAAAAAESKSSSSSSKSKKTRTLSGTESKSSSSSSKSKKTKVTAEHKLGYYGYKKKPRPVAHVAILWGHIEVVTLVTGEVLEGMLSSSGDKQISLSEVEDVTHPSQIRRFEQLTIKNTWIKSTKQYSVANTGKEAFTAMLAERNQRRAAIGTEAFTAMLAERNPRRAGARPPTTPSSEPRSSLSSSLAGAMPPTTPSSEPRSSLSSPLAAAAATSNPRGGGGGSHRRGLSAPTTDAHVGDRVRVRRSNGTIGVGRMIPADRRYLSGDQQRHGYVLVQIHRAAGHATHVRRARLGHSVWKFD